MHVTFVICHIATNMCVLLWMFFVRQSQLTAPKTTWLWIIMRIYLHENEAVWADRPTGSQLICKWNDRKFVTDHFFACAAFLLLLPFLVLVRVWRCCFYSQVLRAFLLFRVKFFGAGRNGEIFIMACDAFIWRNRTIWTDQERPKFALSDAIIHIIHNIHIAISLSFVRFGVCVFSIIYWWRYLFVFFLFALLSDWEQKKFLIGSNVYIAKFMYEYIIWTLYMADDAQPERYGLRFLFG